MGLSVSDFASALGDTLTRGVGGNIDYVARGGKAPATNRRGKPKKGPAEKKVEGGGWLDDIIGGLPAAAASSALSMIPGIGPAASLGYQGYKTAQEMSPSGGGGGGEGKKGKGGGKGKNTGYGGLPGHPVNDLLKKYPGMSRQEARSYIDQYKADSLLPQGLKDIADAAQDQNKAANVDPLAAQMFFQQTVAPYLNQQSQLQQTTAAAGQDYMANLLNTTNLDPAYKQFLGATTPVVLNAQNQAAVAGQQAAMAAPALEDLLNRIQADTNAKEQLRSYREQQDAAKQLQAQTGGVYSNLAGQAAGIAPAT